MEEKHINVFKNKSKKILGIPLALFMVLGVVLVVAGTLVYVAYSHNFVKTINVFKQGGSIDYVSIDGSGDISNSILDCNSYDNECVINGGSIILKNRDLIPHNCYINTSGNGNVIVTYSEDVNPIIIPPYDLNNETKSFNIIYKASEVGKYPMQTTINCP